MRELPDSERPRERLREYGAAVLSNAELLAIILRSGSTKQSVLSLASSLLSRHHGLGGLSRLSFSELMNEPGLGEAKVAEILALFQIAARMQALDVGERPIVNSPDDVFALLGGEMSMLDQEHMRVVLINSRNQVVGVHQIYVGSLHSIVVRPAEVFREAVRQNARSLVVVHNHPSGDPHPSGPDVKLTEVLVEAGRNLEIEVMDHIVIGERRYSSIKGLGLWPPEKRSTPF